MLCLQEQGFGGGKCWATIWLHHSGLWILRTHEDLAQNLLPQRLQNHSSRKFCIPRWRQSQHIDLQWIGEKWHLPRHHQFWLHHEVSEADFVQIPAGKPSSWPGNFCQRHCRWRYWPLHSSTEVPSTSHACSGRVCIGPKDSWWGGAISIGSTFFVLEVLPCCIYLPTPTVHQSLVLWWSLWGASQTAPRPWGTSNCCNSGTPQEKVPPRPAHMHLCRQRTGTGNTQEQNGRMAICDWPPFQACGGSNGAHSQRIHEGKGPTHHADHAAEEGEPEPPHSWWCMPLRAADPEIQAVEEDFQTYSPTNAPRKNSQEMKRNDWPRSAPICLKSSMHGFGRKKLPSTRWTLTVTASGCRRASDFGTKIWRPCRSTSPEGPLLPPVSVKLWSGHDNVKVASNNAGFMPRQWEGETGSNGENIFKVKPPL